MTLSHTLLEYFVLKLV